MIYISTSGNKILQLNRWILTKLCSEAYPEIEVHDIQLAFNITKVSQLDKARFVH